MEQCVASTPIVGNQMVLKLIISMMIRLITMPQMMTTTPLHGTSLEIFNLGFIIRVFIQYHSTSHLGVNISERKSRTERSKKRELVFLHHQGAHLVL